MGDDGGRRLRDRVWQPTESRVRLLTELSLLADEAGHDLYVRRAAVAVAEHAGGACVIALRRGASDVFSVASHVSQARALVGPPVSPFAEMARDVLEAGRGAAVEARSVEERTRPTRFVREAELREQAMVVPLRARGRVTGALGAMTAGRVSDDDLRYLEEVCARVALTVEYLRLAERDDDGESGAPPAPALAPLSELSERQREILGCLATGMTSREMAAQLSISRRTVEWHRERIKEKLGVSGRAALTRVAREAGLG